MCCISPLLLWVLFGLGIIRGVRAEYWVIVKVRINGTTQWEDGADFAPISDVYTITVSNNPNPNNTYDDFNNNYYYDDDGVLRERKQVRELPSVLFDDDHVNWFQTKNETIISKRPKLRNTHLDDTVIGHIIFIAFVDLVVVIGIMLIGMNYIKFGGEREDAE